MYNDDNKKITVIKKQELSQHLLCKDHNTSKDIPRL